MSRTLVDLETIKFVADFTKLSSVVHYKTRIADGEYQVYSRINFNDGASSEYNVGLDSNIHEYITSWFTKKKVQKSLKDFKITDYEDTEEFKRYVKNVKIIDELIIKEFNKEEK